jgi:SSS family solute:Na+ symporter
MIAALMAALLSTADMMMLTTSGLLTQGVYRPLVKNKTEKHYVGVGRAIGAVVVVIAALIVLGSDDLFSTLKQFWEWGVTFSAGFWMGIMWRKTSRLSVIMSMALTLLIFFLVPTIISPSLRTNEYLLKRTNERVIERTYVAHAQDVEFRNTEIAEWEALTDEAKVITPKPEPIEEGKEFTKSYNIGDKKIFWTQGIHYNKKKGVEEGRGMISVELVLLDKLGWNLSKNKYAVNETIRIMIRTVFPFLIIFIFSIFVRRKEEEEAVLDKFYAKMKTKVQPTKEEDEKELALSYSDPHRFDNRKMFPKSNWEMLKWNKEDSIGFIVALGFVVLILALLFFFVNLGGSIFG